MKFASLGLLAGIAFSVVAQDLLFVDSLQHYEFQEAEALGLSTKVVTEAEWATMTTEDFSKFKAIVISDPNCGESLSYIKFLEDSRNVWGPAVTGNIILIGTDPGFHFDEGKAKTLIDNSIKFAAAGTTPAGVPQTGLYFSLSCYYQDVETATVDALSYFGEFTVRGNLECYDKVHLVAHSDAMDSLDDASLSDWSCSVHEAFASYPSVGTFGFQALAIAHDVLGVGSQTFGDGTVGLPYILSRGATPAKCGDGVWDEAIGEECDDGNTLNGDGCSLSCKCESGRARGDGTCFPSNTTTPVGPTGTAPTIVPSETYSKSGYVSMPYGNASATPTYSYPGGHTKPYTPPPYVTPSCPTGPKIVGVEVIVEVTYSETAYVPCSTVQRPIYDVTTSGLPCYVCALTSEHVKYETTDFLTVTTTHCPKCSGGALPTYVPPVVKPCHTCKPYTFTETERFDPIPTVYTYTPVPYYTPVPHTHKHFASHTGDHHSPVKTYTPDHPTFKTYIPTAKPYTPEYSSIKHYPSELPVVTPYIPQYTPGVTTYTTPTGTGYVPYPSGPVLFTGGARKSGVAASGVVGGVIVGLAVFL